MVHERCTTLPHCIPIYITTWTTFCTPVFQYNENWLCTVHSGSYRIQQPFFKTTVLHCDFILCCIRQAQCVNNCEGFKWQKEFCIDPWNAVAFRATVEVQGCITDCSNGHQNIYDSHSLVCCDMCIRAKRSQHIRPCDV